MKKKIKRFSMFETQTNTNLTFGKKQIQQFHHHHNTVIMQRQEKLFFDFDFLLQTKNPIDIFASLKKNERNKIEKGSKEKIFRKIAKKKNLSKEIPHIKKNSNE